MFQFLIGRLGTSTRVKANLAVAQFQFLIGRLGTIQEALLKYYNIRGFNSL